MEIMRRTGISKPTVWRWQARYLEAGVDGLLRDKSRPPGTPPLSAAIKTLVADQDDARDAAGRDPLERALDGARGRHQPHQRPEYLARARPQAASGGQLQGLQRPGVRGESRGRGRPLPRSAGQGGGLFGRREEPNPGTRPQPTGPAHEEGPGRHHDPRLQAPRHDHPVRGAQPARWQGHRPLHEAPPPPGVHSFPQPDRPPNPALSGHSPDHRQLRHPQDAGGQTVAEKTPALPHPFHPDIGLLAQHGRALLRRDHPKTHPARRLQKRRRVEQAIYDYLAIHNHNPVPFVWTATATAILEKTARAKQTLETVRAGTKC